MGSDGFLDGVANDVAEPRKMVRGLVMEQEVASLARANRLEGTFDSAIGKYLVDPMGHPGRRGDLAGVRMGHR
jgi:hypothetical protein